jgi:hypothetical protein
MKPEVKIDSWTYTTSRTSARRRIKRLRSKIRRRDGKRKTLEAHSSFRKEEIL